MACTSDARRFLTNGYRLSMHAFALVRMLLDIRFSLDVSLVGIGTQRQLRGKYWQHVLPTRIGRIHWPRPDFSASSTAFENEQVAELIDRTAHVAALTALIKTPTAYRYYLAVYVWDVSPFTLFYMAMINPCRRRIVYPSLLRVVRARWNQAFGNG